MEVVLAACLYSDVYIIEYELIGDNIYPKCDRHEYNSILHDRTQNWALYANSYLL